MFQYLEKFKKLPKELQEAMTSAAAVKVIDELEKKYGINLNVLVMKIMVKEIPWSGIAEYLVKEKNIEKDKAEKMKKEMEEKLFNEVSGYLGISQAMPKDGAEDSKAKEANSVKVKKDVSEPEDVLDGIPDVEARMPEAEEKKQASSSIEGFHLRRRPEAKISSAPPVIDADKTAEEILPKALGIIGIQGGDEILSSRLKNIIKIYLKGVRDGLDTAETLKKPKDVGGLGLSADKAEKIVKVLKENKNSGEFTENKFAPAPDKSAYGRLGDSSFAKTVTAKPQFKSVDQIMDVEYEFKTNKEEKKADDKKPAQNQPPAELPAEKEIKEDNKKLGGDRKIVQPGNKEAVKEGGGRELAPPPPTVINPKEIKKEALKSKKASGAEQEEKKTVQVRRQPILSPLGDKKRMDDILKPPGRLQGPVEELGNMDLVNFKRLADEPKEAAKKIKEKIELLGEESYTKRHQGINAWRNSPLYKMYLAIGQQSIKEGKPVEEVIKEKNGQSLSAEQFNAVLDLNKELRV